MQSPPQYLGVAEALKSEIQSFGYNALLPSEEQLAKRFGVSRVTVRRALGILEQSGLIDRQRGRGTIVNPRKVTRTMWPPLRIEEDFRQQGISMRTEVLSVERGAEVPEDIRRQLQLSNGQGVAKISLLRTVDDRVICLDCRYVADSIIAHIDVERVGEIPVSTLISESVRKPIVGRHWELEFVPCSAEDAKILRITAGTLVVSSTGTHYAARKSPLWITKILYRIDRVKFAFGSLDARKDADETPGVRQ